MPLRIWPVPEPNAVIHICHGLAEHSGRYKRFARALNAHGLTVIAHDHRGHGAAITPKTPRGVFDLRGLGIQNVLDDLAAVGEAVGTRYPGVPLVLFGHSMGGLIAFNSALHTDRALAGCAVWNSNFDGGLAGRAAQLLLGYERFRLGADAPSRLLPRLTFQAWARQITNRRTDFDWLSHIDEEVDAYIADPLCGWGGTVSLWQDIFKFIFSGRDLSNAMASTRALPFHFVGGGHDPATSGGKAVANQVARMKSAGFQSVTHRLYPETRHETHNDCIAPDAIKDLCSWIKSIV